MQVAQVDDEAAFIEMGLDSISSATWMRQVSDHYGISMAAPEVYNHPTLTKLTNHVIKKRKEQGVSLWKKKPILSPSISPQKKLPIRQTTRPLARIERRPIVRSLTIVEQDQRKEQTTPAIAVIGMAGQFPKAKTIREFWDNLVNGRDCISEIPAERWSIDQYYNPDPEISGKTYSKWVGLLEDADKFDPLFSNISPLEAESMDPQQRLFLETCWGCIEDAGYKPSNLSGSKCGVFAGCTTNDYRQLLGSGDINAQGLMGGAMSILAARIAYLLNLQGPCLAIDAACSSSLVAIASGCDSLVLGSSDLVLAGGVCVMAGPAAYYDEQGRYVVTRGPLLYF